MPQGNPTEIGRIQIDFGGGEHLSITRKVTIIHVEDGIKYGIINFDDRLILVAAYSLGKNWAGEAKNSVRIEGR